MRSAILAIAISFICAASASAEKAEHIPLSSKGIGATIVSLQGLDTRSAKMIAKITRYDAEEYFQRDPGGETRRSGGKLTFNQCVRLYLRYDEGRTFVASANCRMKKIFSTYRAGNPYVAKYIIENGERNLVWKSLISGEERGQSTAGGGDVLSVQFATLCPKSPLE